MWILIITVMFSGHNKGGAAVTSVEFESAQSCEAALVEYKNQNLKLGRYDEPYAICVKK